MSPPSRNLLDLSFSFNFSRQEREGENAGGAGGRSAPSHSAASSSSRSLHGHVGRRKGGICLGIWNFPLDLGSLEQAAPPTGRVIYSHSSHLCFPLAAIPRKKKNLHFMVPFPPENSPAPQGRWEAREGVRSKINWEGFVVSEQQTSAQSGGGTAGVRRRMKSRQVLRTKS